MWEAQGDGSLKEHLARNNIKQENMPSPVRNFLANKANDIQVKGLTKTQTINMVPKGEKGGDPFTFHAVQSPINVILDDGRTVLAQLWQDVHPAAASSGNPQHMPKAMEGVDTLTMKDLKVFDSCKSLVSISFMDLHDK